MPINLGEDMPEQPSLLQDLLAPKREPRMVKPGALSPLTT
jgi:hypothetical protein